MLPGLDAHTGDVPNLEAQVELDHWIILGSQDQRSQRMQRVHYSEKLSPLAAALLPKYVTGKQFYGQMKNGDFVGSRSAIAEGPQLLQRGLLVG
jgi:hypothetical protein